MLDAEAILRRARRPLVIGMGGGGDVVGALATAEFSRLYDGADPVVGGLTWERRAIDPVPGPRVPSTKSPAARSWRRGSCWPTRRPGFATGMCSSPSPAWRASSARKPC